MDLTDDPAGDLRDRARQLETLDRLAQRFGQSLSTALAGGTADGRQLSGVLDRITSTLGKGAGSAFGSALASGLQGALRSLTETASALSFGGAVPFARGGVVPFASGGVVASPTYFPLRGGTGLMGEAGPEAVMPLARGPDGRLGVRAGAAAASPPITVTIQAADLDSFRRSEAQVSAALARAVARGRRAL